MGGLPWLSSQSDQLWLDVEAIYRRFAESMLSWRRADVLPLVWIRRAKSYFYLLKPSRNTTEFRGLEICRRWLWDHLSPQSQQTWMLSSIPPSSSRFRVKDRSSFTSRTSPDYNRLPRTAHPQPSSRASWLPTWTSATESCLKLQYVQNPAAFWPYSPPVLHLAPTLAIISLISQHA